MSEHEHEHVVGLKVYFTIITILMVLTAITVWAAFQDFGFLNNVVAMTIAVIKALLVVLFFMHLRHMAHIVWLFAGAGAVWFIIMISLLLGDYRTRDWQYNASMWEKPPVVQNAAPSAHQP